MGIWGFIANVATRGAYGALEAGIDAVTQTRSTAPSDRAGSGMHVRGNLQDLLNQERLSEERQKEQKGRDICCDRYRLSEGFLVDGMTGLVWQFDQAKKSFVEVPRIPPEHKKPLFKAIFETRLQAARTEFETQLALPLPSTVMKHVNEDFERQMIEPLRKAIGLD
jgi:hypothetical protein